MPDTKEVNPLREGLSSRAMPQPCAVVIFGATGDLTHRKLVPALYNLAADGALPPAVSVVGFARREKSDEVFRKELEEAARKFSRQKISDELWAGFASSIFYHRSEFHALEGYESLAKRLDELDGLARDARESPFLSFGWSRSVPGNSGELAQERSQPHAGGSLGARHR